MGSWPKTWAERGDGHTIVSKDPRKAMDLSFRCYIEGSSYTKPTTYIPMKVSDNFRDVMREYYTEEFSIVNGAIIFGDMTNMKRLNCEWLAISTHTEGYPSGGSVEYASFAYFNKEKLYTGGQARVNWKRAQFYRIDRGFMTLQEFEAYQRVEPEDLPKELASLITEKNKDLCKGYRDGHTAFMLYVASRYARIPGRLSVLQNEKLFHIPVVENSYKETVGEK